MARAPAVLHACVAAALAATSFGARVAAQPVYRCDDGKGGVLYADTPCTGGATVDLLPGKADPAAIERLRREQRAYDERQAARELRAQQEVLAQREHRLAQREWQLEAGAALPADRYVGESGYYWGGLWPWYPAPPVAPVPRVPAWPTRPELQSAPYVPATPGRFGMPSPPPARLAPRPPAPGKPPAPAPRG